MFEGQPPSSEPVKVKPSKLNAIKKEIVKKGSKTVPRKGVTNLIEKLDQNDTNHDLLLEKSGVEQSGVASVNDAFKKQTILKNGTTLLTSTEKPKAVETMKEKSFSSKVTPSSTTTRKKPKPKPLLTVGGKEPDGPIPPTPTKKSPVIALTKIDYIVPVLITITALPLLGVAFYALFKSGRDYWSKRHYRRMDFLIDGMYNE